MSASERSQLEARILRANAAVVPQVAEILGYGPYEARIEVLCHEIPGWTMARTELVQRSYIQFGPELDGAPDNFLRYLVAHEQVHVHCRGVWEKLPLCLEEALGYMIAIDLVPKHWRGLLESSFSNFEHLRYYDLVRPLGVEGLRALAQRAHDEGLEEVPLAWVEEVSPPP